jgi:hypothetical protein
MLDGLLFVLESFYHEGNNNDCSNGDADGIGVGG